MGFLQKIPVTSTLYKTKNHVWNDTVHCEPGSCDLTAKSLGIKNRFLRVLFCPFAKYVYFLGHQNIYIFNQI